MDSQHTVEETHSKRRLSRPKQRHRWHWKWSSVIRTIRPSFPFQKALLTLLFPFCLLPPTTATHYWWLASTVFFSILLNSCQLVSTVWDYTRSISPTAYRGFSSFQTLSNVPLCKVILCTASSTLYEVMLLLCCSFPAITAFLEVVQLCPWSGFVCLFTSCSGAQFICIHIWS